MYIECTGTLTNQIQEDYETKIMLKSSYIISGNMEYKITICEVEYLLSRKFTPKEIMQFKVKDKLKICNDFSWATKVNTKEEKECMVNMGPEYLHCKGCLRCVEICPVDALVKVLEKDYPQKPYDQPNKALLTTHFSMEKHGADASITGESHLTEQQIDGGVL